MAGRPKLGDLLSAVEPRKDATLAEPPASVVTLPGPDESPAPRHLEAAADRKVSPGPSRGARQPATQPPAPRNSTQTVGTGPRYLELIRKEARFTDEQLEQLNALTRRLNKARRGRGERLTDNTLIRVAVDLLLAQQGKLNGATEDELRKSVNL